MDKTVVACEMDGVARRLVHGLKYRGVRAFAPVMAELLRSVEPGFRPGAAFAVPLHRSRERRRGFNQAAELLGALDWPCGPGVLERSRGTRSQVGRHERERRRNVAGAFSYEGPDLDGLEVAVVDDVITTGATVTECARVLRERGAAAIVAVAFARAHYEPGESRAIFD